MTAVMGWLTKIFKGSGHRISEGQYHRNYNNDTIWEEPRHSVDASSEFDIEEIDRAIALSLAEEEARALSDDEDLHKIQDEDLHIDEDLHKIQDEDPSKIQDEDHSKIQEDDHPDIQEEDHHVIQEEDHHVIQEEDHHQTQEEEHPKIREEDQKGKKVVESEPRLEEDEQLAKALQESLRVESPPRYDYGSFFPPYPYYHPPVYRTCAGCKDEVGHGRYLSCMGGVWHPECFRCRACGHPISDYEFSMYENMPYHKACYKELHHPRCDVCINFIPTNPAGLIEYRAHPFWLQKYCPSHEQDGTPRCCSCERMEPVDAKYLILEDGRKLCLECLDSSIMDTHECQPLYLEIQDFYEGLLMKVEQQVPLLLVERQALNEAMEGEKNGHHMPETRGLCLSEEQTVSTISRRPRIGGHRIVDMFTEPYRLIRQCEVTAILILYGLPRLLTGSILAHEMMHAWLRLKGYPNLRPDVEEGICQVLAHMWLDSEIMAGSGSSSAASSSASSSSSSSSSSTSSKKGKRSSCEKKLGEFFKHQIESDTSSAYGDGFREGNAAVLKYGLRRTLDHIRLTGCFP